MSKILIVEDEESIRGFLKINLKRSGFEVAEAESGEKALEIIEKNTFDLVILDVMLPGIDGFYVCNILRERFKNLAIIMLTAKGQDMDKIMGLEYGADDYVVKPFNPMELLLRVKAVLRRIKGENDDNSLRVGKFIIDYYKKKVLKGDLELDLTPKEYSLIKLFLENPQKAFKRDELLDIVWGENYFGDSKIIDVNIRRLRSKLMDNDSKQGYIETVWGFGYRWSGDGYEKHKE